MIFPYLIKTSRTKWRTVLADLSVQTLTAHASTLNAQRLAAYASNIQTSS